MPVLPTTTPQRTVPISSFIVYLMDGRVIQVMVNGGEGFFRQQTISGSEKSIATHECFIVNGRWKILPRFGGEKMSTEEAEPDEEETPDEDED